MSEDVFFNDFKIICEHVEMIMTFLVFYSLIDEFWNEQLFWFKKP